jgi:hypothetical protein
LAAVIASQQGVDHVVKHIQDENVTLWIGAVDPEMTPMSYIVPGLGEAGDLAFGVKIDSHQKKEKVIWIEGKENGKCMFSEFLFSLRVITDEHTLSCYDRLKIIPSPNSAVKSKVDNDNFFRKGSIFFGEAILLI